MTNSSDSPGSVRVDTFKPSGKWYDTFALDMGPEFPIEITQDAVGVALARAGRGAITQELSVVVLAPYCKNAHPVMMLCEQHRANERELRHLREAASVCRRYLSGGEFIVEVSLSCDTEEAYRVTVTSMVKTLGRTVARSDVRGSDRNVLSECIEELVEELSSR